jgi:hypothetical protein
MRRKAFKRSTYLTNASLPIDGLNTYLHAIPLRALEPHKRSLYSLGDHSVNHRFDILGSGWMQVKRGMTCRGERDPVSGTLVLLSPSHNDEVFNDLNPTNIEEAGQIRELLDRDYAPIDWHMDFKSGFRWRQDIWHADIQYGKHPGVDIKVPWELSRMQHLPSLALAYGLAGHVEGRLACSTTGSQGVDTRDAERFAREFRNQVLDFMAANPPGFGVNWVSSMDVAIRMANWLMAYDLFTAFGAEFEPEFRRLLERSAFEHGRHIINNLERSYNFRANHYLANVVGLLFVAAYLPRTAETDVWLAFAAQELVSEVERQFLPDGMNFEASTSYHRLSLEMALYASALIIGLPDDKVAAFREYDATLLRVRPALRPGPVPLYPLPGSNHMAPLPSSYWERLKKAVEASAHIVTEDGHTGQIGDNDNGRFFKIHPAHRSMTVSQAKQAYANLLGYEELPEDEEYLVEDHLDHLHLLHAFSGLLDPSDTPLLPRESFESEIVRSLARGTTIRPDSTFSIAVDEWLQAPSAETERSAGLHERFVVHDFPHFGLYVFRSPRLRLHTRCRPKIQDGRGCHAHNDQLSFELWLDGDPIVIGPGTYCYTSFVQTRNLFRSTLMHNTLALESREQNSWEDGLAGVFRLSDEAKGEILKLGNDVFVGRHLGFGTPHVRTIRILADKILGSDELDTPGAKQICFHLHPTVKVSDSRPKDGVLAGCGDLVVTFEGGPGEWEWQRGLYSPGYGILQRNRTLRLVSSATRIDWSISVS